MMKTGFTLVELSIVLVVIGLLIGGILVGQSLIEAARVQSVAKQLQEYSIVGKLFKQRYKYYPGDLPNGSTIFGSACGTYCNGNGNNSSTGDEVPPYYAENYLYFHHMQMAGILQTKLSYVLDTTAANVKNWSGKFLPNLGLKDTVVMYDTSTYSMNDYCKNALRVGTLNSADPINGGVVRNAYRNGLEPKLVAALDSKVDDGTPTAGTVIALPEGGYTGNCSTFAGGLGATTNKYTLPGIPNGCYTWYCLDTAN